MKLGPSPGDLQELAQILSAAAAMPGRILNPAANPVAIASVNLDLFKGGPFQLGSGKIDGN
jgi:hypothetical protein